MNADRDIVTTKFGTVSDRRIQLIVRKGLGSKRTEDIPLRHVTSVVLAVERKLGPGIAVGLFALYALIKGFGDMNPLAIFAGLILAGIAVVLLLPDPTITISTSGGQTRVTSGTFTDRHEAKRFTDAIQTQLFRHDRDRDHREDALTPRWG